MKHLENSCGCGCEFAVFPTYEDCVSCDKKMHCGFRCFGSHDIQYCVQCVSSQMVRCLICFVINVSSVNVQSHIDRYI